MDWIALAWDRGRWRLLVNEVMNLGFPQNSGNFCLAEDVLAPEEGIVLCGVS